MIHFADLSRHWEVVDVFLGGEIECIQRRFLRKALDEKDFLESPCQFG